MKIGILMDPLSNIHIYKDTSFAMLLVFRARDYELHYMKVSDIFLQNGKVHTFMRCLRVKDNTSDWFELSDSHIQPLIKWARYFPYAKRSTLQYVLYLFNLLIRTR